MTKFRGIKCNSCGKIMDCAEMRSVFELGEIPPFLVYRGLPDEVLVAALCSSKCLLQWHTKQMEEEARKAVKV